MTKIRQFISHLSVDGFIAVPEDRPSLGVPAEDVRAANGRKHRRRDGSREGPLVLDVQVLRADDHLVAGHTLHLTKRSKDVLHYVAENWFRENLVAGVRKTCTQ